MNYLLRVAAVELTDNSVNLFKYLNFRHIFAFTKCWYFAPPSDNISACHPPSSPLIASACRELLLVVQTTCYGSMLAILQIIMYIVRGAVKKRSFNGQADCKGGWGSAPSALNVSKCENCDPYFII